MARLHATQKGACFICEASMDLTLHAGSLDIDHVVPTKGGGSDGPENFALTHASCNRSKQASDLQVARVLAQFSQIKAGVATEDRAANLNDVFQAYGGAKFGLTVEIQDGLARFSLPEVGRNEIQEAAIYEDELGDLRYFFAKLPIEYLHHDDRINPRGIGSNLAGLVEEFHRHFPQLHVALGWISATPQQTRVRIFDGQHKAAAQVLLGVKALPVRIFIDPDPDRLLTANTHAGTTLRQVAFDKSVQRLLGSSLFDDRLSRFRKERGLAEDDESFSERDLVQYFRLESREMKRYVLDATRAAITHHSDNQLKHYVEFGGKAQEKPLSYSTLEKTFLSFFIYPDLLETSINYRLEEGLNPRVLEISQVVQIMNVVANEIYVGKYELEIGAKRIEYRVQKGELVPESHLRAHRLSREEILYVWLGYVRQIIQLFFTMAGPPFDEKKLFQYPFPEALWDRIRSYVSNLALLPVWVNRDLSQTVFGGKQNYDFWKTIFETGKSPQGQQVLAEPINLMKMMEP